MSRLLVVGAFVWPALLGLSVWPLHGPSRSVLTTTIYLAASKICHQRPGRSFHTEGVQWPVCARCSGLYLSAPVGAMVAAAWGRRRSANRAVLLLAAAAVP